MALVTFVAGDVLTAAQLNDSFGAVLKEPTSASVATSQSTSSSSYTDLATSGPAVTVTTGTTALVILYYNGGTNSGDANCASFMSFAVSGATTISAADARSVGLTSAGNSFVMGSGSGVFVVSGLTAGSNTFTAKYRSTAGGGATTPFAERQIMVIPL
jgi:hypothetical protein